MIIRTIYVFLFTSTLCLGLVVSWLWSISASSRQAVPLAAPDPTAVTTTSQPETGTAPPPRIDNQAFAETRVEYFSDDQRIGLRKKNKVEIRCFSNKEGRFAEIKFFGRSEYGAWLERQAFRFEKDGVTDCDPVVEDFNNDGLNDFTYQSTVAARGSNEVRRLFVYDKEHDELVYIKNSQSYPNLAYNKKLRCIDAFLVYGATSTVFLRIKGDELREFARVETGEELIVSIIDKSGTERVVSREKMNPDNFEEIFRRFSTYSPPR